MHKITLTKAEGEKYNRLLDMDEVDFEAEEVEEDALLLSKTVDCGDGVFAELKVCSGQTNLWAEIVWFCDGDEVCCTEPFFELEAGVVRCGWDDDCSVEIAIA